MDYINLKEKSSHGNSLFPLHVYTHINKVGSYSVNAHWHNEIEIIYVEKGEFEIIVDMNTYTLKTGDYIFINSGSIHSIASVNTNISIHHAMVFDSNLLTCTQFDICQINYISPLSNKSLKLPSFINNDSKIYDKILNELICIIKSYKYKNIGFELIIKGALFKILSYIAQENKFLKNNNINSPSANYKLDLIKKVFIYIDKNYLNKIYIEDLAKEVNMNSQYFCRFFKSVIGKTPIDYINNYRIEKSVELLVTTNDKILNICYSVGFDNFSYFIKTFKKIKNCTPSEYRTTYSK